MIKKENVSDISQVRERILSGVKKMFDMISPTLGPAGLSGLIWRPTGEPLLVDDGRRIAENIKLEDEIEQMAVRICYEVTKKTDEKAGDGTTTAMTLSYGILKEIVTNYLNTGIGANGNVNEIEQKLKESKDEVIKRLEEMAIPVKTQKQLQSVATISAGNPEWGKMIADMYWDMGKDSHICLEFNLIGEKVESEIASGYRFTGGYATPWVVSDPIRNVCTLEEAKILITKNKVENFTDELLPIANLLTNSGVRRLVVIAPKFSKNVIEAMYKNAFAKTPFHFVAVQAPGRNEGAYQDMAIYTGAKYFGPNEEIGMATLEDLGYVRQFEVSEDTCILTDGAGKKEDIKKRIKEVEADANNQKMHQFKKDRLERMSALTGKVGVIRIGAPTNDERNWNKYKIEDARYATKHAYQTGILPGGGQALKVVAETLPDDNVLKSALLLPTEVLKRNGGGKLSVGKDVFDPLAVEKAAIEYACSAVSKLMRAGTAICRKEENFAEKLGQLLNPIQEDED